MISMHSWCVSRQCGLEPLRLDWFCATKRLFHPLSQCNRQLLMKLLLADIHLISSYILMLQQLSQLHVLYTQPQAV